MGTFGQIHLTDLSGRYRALTRFRETQGTRTRVQPSANGLRYSSPWLSTPTSSTTSPFGRATHSST